MMIVLALASSAVFAVLNAVRGAGFFSAVTGEQRSRNGLRWLIAALAGVASFGFGEAPLPDSLSGILGFVPLWTAVGVMVFMVQPWGRWYTFGRLPREASGPPTAWESFVEDIADSATDSRAEADALAWLLSASAFTVPLIVMASPWWFVLPVATVAIYAGAWRVFASNAIRSGEVGKGFLIGMLVAMLA